MSDFFTVCLTARYQQIPLNSVSLVSSKLISYLFKITIPYIININCQLIVW